MTTVVNRLHSNPAYSNPCVSFRKEFDVADPSQFESLHLFLRRDDSALIFINGQLAIADNIDPAADHNSAAKNANGPTEFDEWKHYMIDPARLIPGRNLITVDVHQHPSTVPALFFDLQLIGGFKAMPKLNLAAGNGALELRWPAAYTGWVVERSTDLQSWTPVVIRALIDGSDACVQLAMQGGRGFYRLVKR